MAATAPSYQQTTCPDCGTAAAPEALSCPICGRLTHGDELAELAQKAKLATASGDLSSAIAHWTRALGLLPPETVQYASVQAKIMELQGQQETQQAKANSGWKGKATGIGSTLLLLLAKGKYLLLGLTKMSTLLSMFGFFGVYWALFGWPFALGLVLSIYIHEMGHVITLRNYGIAASAPMFIPFFGAFIGLRSAAITPVQDSRIGLAGPIYGFGAALFTLAVFYATGWRAWGAIAYTTAVMNLFNLIPVWQLDGARGLHSLTLRQRISLLVVTIVLWASTRESFLFLIAMGLGYRLFTKDAAQEPDAVGFRQFVFLLAALTAVATFAHITGT